MQRVGGEIGSHDSQGLAKHNVGTTEPRFEGKPTPPYLQGSSGGRPAIVAAGSPAARLATLAGGFAVLGLSTFRVTAYMGLLTSLTVASALVVDFLLLPAILLTFDRRVVKYPVPNAALVGVPSGAD